MYLLLFCCCVFLGRLQSQEESQKGKEEKKESREEGQEERNAGWRSSSGTHPSHIFHHSLHLLCILFI